MKYLKLIFASLLISCTATESLENKFNPDEFKKEIIEVHDEVMPKMGELRKASKTLRNLADTITSVDSTAIDILIEKAEKLEKANQSMMVWMRQYEPNFTSDSEEELKKYLDEQMEGITQVRTDMLNALKEGKEALKEYNL